MGQIGVLQNRKFGSICFFCLGAFSLPEGWTAGMIAGIGAGVTGAIVGVVGMKVSPNIRGKVNGGLLVGVIGAVNGAIAGTLIRDMEVAAFLAWMMGCTAAVGVNTVVNARQRKNKGSG